MISNAPPPRYSETDERSPLISTKKKKEAEEDVNLKQVLGVRRSSLLLSFYCVFYLVYLLTGGLVFAVLEAPVEAELRDVLEEARTTFLARNPCVSGEDLEGLLEVILTASNKGVSARSNTSESNWSFGQSLFFSSTVVTTIGYGHVTPISRAGKLFCIVYAMVGIPMTLMLMTALVERLLVPSTQLLEKLTSCLGHLYHPLNIQVLHLSIVGAILLIFFLLLPAAAFASVESDWDYLDSLYYCFISLTTIGLGDYIPGDQPEQPYRPLYKILITAYLLAGLTYVVFTLTVFYDIPQLNFGLFFLKQSDEDEEDVEKPCAPVDKKERDKDQKQILPGLLQVQCHT